jgi:pyruvate dehydrogenase E2 component (dihydrolipoamide acetyltransferase)
MPDFLMPSLGADMESGKVMTWLVAPGSRVKRGDVVAVVETQKGAIDVEIFLDGVIDALVPPGTERRVGEVLAQVSGAGEVPAPANRAAPAPAPISAPVPALAPVPLSPGLATVTAAVATATPSIAVTGRAKASPAARHRASELALDVGRMRGTGVEGAVTLADVEAAALRPAATAAIDPAVATAVPAGIVARRGFDPAQMRQAIAAAMSRSKREIPHYYLASTIDFGAATTWLAAANRGRGPEERLLPAALLLAAAARALAEVPQLNGFHVDGAFRPGAGVHVGWAVALRGGGLIAPAVHDADRKTATELMVALRDLVQRARTGGLRSSELGDPTATVTSLGDRGAERVLGVIHPPQVAMIGFGRVVERPWVVDGQLVPRALVEASLAGDHRASDGHVGGLLLAAIDRHLQAPALLDSRST